jgi:hypothetical protein
MRVHIFIFLGYAALQFSAHVAHSIHRFVYYLREEREFASSVQGNRCEISFHATFLSRYFCGKSIKVFPEQNQQSCLLFKVTDDLQTNTTLIE